MNLVLEDRTKVLRRGFFDVQNRVGVSRDEEDYHQAMVLWLDENRVPCMSKPPHPLSLYGEVAHKLFPDFVAWDQITIEMKAIPRNPSSTEFVQLFDYLKCRGDPLDCLLIENSIVLTYTALFDSNEFNMNRGRSYLKALNMPWGVAANFGKSEAQFTGVRRL
jgi:GxxExxY protein